MALAGNSTSLQSLQPWLRPFAKSLVSLAPQVGATRIRITSTRRSRAQQVALYKSFLAGRSSYPVAPPGSSMHELGLAFDVVTEPYSALAALGALWQKAGFTWNASDPIHFEATPPRASAKILKASWK